MKYKTDRKWAAFMTIGDIVLLTILWLSPTTYDYLPTAFVVTVFFIAVSLWSFEGVYLTIENGKVCHINYFLIKKCFNIKDIDSIYYQPSWSIGETARSLNIIDLSTGEQKDISLPNLGFSEKTLAQIARHLKQLNSFIKFDEHTEALVKKYG